VPVCFGLPAVGWLSGFLSCLFFVSGGRRLRLAARCVLSRFRAVAAVCCLFAARCFFSVVSVGPQVCCVLLAAVCRLSAGSFLGLPVGFPVALSRFPASAAALLRPLLSRLFLVFRALSELL
jgi:hypothetical protein